MVVVCSVYKHHFHHQHQHAIMLHDHVKPPHHENERPSQHEKQLSPSFFPNLPSFLIQTLPHVRHIMTGQRAQFQRHTTIPGHKAFGQHWGWRWNIPGSRFRKHVGNTFR